MNYSEYDDGYRGESLMTRQEILDKVGIWTKQELALRTNEQLQKIYELLSEKYDETLSPEYKPFVEEKLVALFVTPVIQICDQKYGGNVKVTEAVASQLRYIMQQHRSREAKNVQFVDHGVRNHGEIK